jgi:hypothetical protein
LFERWSGQQPRSVGRFRSGRQMGNRAAAG